MIVKQLFLLCLTAALYGSIMGAVVLAVEKLLKEQLTASAKFMFWVIVTIRFLLPFAPESRASIFNLLPDRADGAVALSGDNIVVNLTGAPAAFAGAELIQICAYIWLAGCCAVFLWFAIPQIVMQIRMSLLPKDTDERITRILDDCLRKLRISRRITAVFQSQFKTPALTGIIRPKILLTDEVRSFPDEDIKYILMHELCHHKRHDILYKYTAIAVRSLHWFNPLAWLFTGRAMRGAELAADEKVMMFIGDGENKDYGRAIINTSARLSVYGFGAVMGMADKKSDLRTRITRISKFKRPGAALRIIGVTAVLVLGVTGLTNAKLPDALTPEPVFDFGVSGRFSPDIPDEAVAAAADESESLYSQNAALQNAQKPPANAPAAENTARQNEPRPAPQSAETASRPQTETDASVPSGGSSAAASPVPTLAPTSAPEAEAPENAPGGSVFASRSDLLPGTTIEDVAESEAGAEEYSLSAGKNEVAITADQNGSADFYIESAVSDMISVRVTNGAGATLGRIYITPRAYNSYTINGLEENEKYILEINTPADARMLTY